MNRPPVIDSHLHVWDLGSGGYDWLRPEHGRLYASFTPEQAARELEATGVARAVLVQAEDSERDTRYLLDVADRFPFVAGVVGWVLLEDPPRAVAQLEDYGRHRAFRGVRHLVHDDPRDDFLQLSSVRESLRLLAERGLPFDVPDAWPRHLAAVADLADALPDLTVVVDHLGKPPRGRPDFDAWARAFREVARRPNTVAKLSGLQTPGAELSASGLRQVWNLALEVYGPSRLMYGGDWPMTVPFGGYALTWQVLSTLVDELTADERAAVLGGTAARVYRLRVTDV
ncbi:MAG TPA: amidohydrolase family protein [Nocardioidaceae bacterium]